MFWPIFIAATATVLHRLMTTGVTDTFYSPCLTCGGSIEFVAGSQVPHNCQRADADQGRIAHAYWSGHDRAREAASPTTLADIRALCDAATTVHAKLVLRDRIRDVLDGEGA